MPTVATTISQLIRSYNMPLSVPVHTDNPYEGKIDFGAPADPELYRSPLGTPVVADITFLGRTYTNQAGKQVTFNDFKIATVLITVSQSKRIVITDIQGRNNSVKEYIGDGDYQVTIAGIILGTNGAYPYDVVRDLKDMLDAPIEIAVVSRYLQNLDIYNIVVTDYDLPQEAGSISFQNFTIQALSDVPTELIINDADDV